MHSRVQRFQMCGSRRFSLLIPYVFLIFLLFFFLLSLAFCSPWVWPLGYVFFFVSITGFDWWLYIHEVFITQWQNNEFVPKWLWSLETCLQGLWLWFLLVLILTLLISSCGNASLVDTWCYKFSATATESLYHEPIRFWCSVVFTCSSGYDFDYVIGKHSCL